MANTVRIGGARVDLTGRDAEFQKVMRSAAQQFRRQQMELRKTRRQAKLYNSTLGALKGRLVAVASVAGVGALASSIKAAATETAAWGSDLQKVSQRLGTTAEELHAIESAFEDDNVAITTTRQNLTALSRRFAADAPKMREAAEAVGISLAEWDATGGDLAQLLPIISRAMAGNATQAAKLNFLQEAGSTSARKFLTTLQRGETVWNETTALYRENARGLDEATRKLEEFDQALTDIQRGNQLALAKTFSENTDDFASFLTWVNGFKQAAIELGAALGKVHSGLKAVLDLIPGVDFAEELPSTLPALREMQRDTQQLVNAARVARTQFEAELDREYERSRGPRSNFLAAIVTDLHDAGEDYRRSAMRLSRINLEIDRRINPFGNVGRRAPGGTTGGGGDAGTQERLVLDREYHRQLSELRDSAAREAMEKRDELRRLEKKYRDEDVRAEAEKARTVARLYREQAESAERAAEQAREAWMATAGTISASIGQSVADFITGTGSMKDAFRSFANSVIQEIARIAVAQRVAGFILNLFAASGGGGLPAGGPGGNYVGPRAGGGPVWPGGSFMVGESGPELFTPSERGYVHRSGTGPGGMNVTFTGPLVGSIQSSDGPGVRAALAESSPAIVQAAQEGIMRALKQPGSARKTVLGY